MGYGFLENLGWRAVIELHNSLFHLIDIDHNILFD